METELFCIEKENILQKNIRLLKQVEINFPENVVYYGKRNRNASFYNTINEISVPKKNCTSNLLQIKIKCPSPITIEPSKCATSSLKKIPSIDIKDKKSNKINDWVVKSTSFMLETNPTARDYMEDYVNVSNIFNNKELHNHGLFLLCDGHQGYVMAEKVCNDFPQVFYNNLKLISNKVEFEKNREPLINEAIITSFKEMDRILKELAEKNIEDEEECKAGTTINLVYICIENGKRVVYSANLGDSRTVLIQKQGAVRLSYDHKATDKKEQKRVKKDGGIIAGGKRFYGVLAITRTLGDFYLKDEETPGLSIEPHITRTEITENDLYILIGSDGVWDVITDNLAHEILVKDDTYKKTENIADLFIKKSMELKSRDNLSCIALKLN